MWKNLIGFISGLFLKNLLTKILCLVMSFLLFIYIQTSENIEKTFTIPVSIANRPPSLLVTSWSDKQVEVFVYGPIAKMAHIKAEELSLTLFLDEQQLPGQVEFSLTPDQVKVPPGIHVRSIRPTFMAIKLESIVAKSFKIQPVIEGTAKDGYEVVDIGVLDPVAEVLGPPSVLSRMVAIETEPIDLDGMSVSFKQRVGFRIPNQVSLSKEHRAIVAVTIREKIAQRTLEDVAVVATSGRLALQIRPPVVSIELEGPQSLIQSMTAERLKPSVHDEGLKEGASTRLPVELESQPERLAAKFIPVSVLVTVQRSDSQSETGQSLEREDRGSKEAPQ